MKKPEKCEFCNEEPATEIRGRLERREDGTLGLTLWCICPLCGQKQELQSLRKK